MRFHLKTFMLLLSIFLVVLGWGVDRYYQAQSFRAQRDALVQEKEALRQEIAVRDLNVKLLEAIVAARSARNGTRYAQLCGIADGIIDRLAGYGPRAKSAMESYVEAVRVPRWPGSEYEFGGQAIIGLAAVGPDAVPFILGLLKDDDRNVRRLAIGSLTLLLDPRAARVLEAPVRQLSAEEAQQIETPLRSALATEKEDHVALGLDRLLRLITERKPQ